MRASLLITDILESLSDSQVAELGLKYWNKSNSCHASSTYLFSEAASKCEKELERRIQFRKINEDMLQ